MARPEKDRLVHKPPLFSEFKPAGIPSKSLIQVLLSIDEYEAFRLSDYLGMSQLEAAQEMEVSRPTFTRLIEKARKKVADFIVQGKILSIQGGNIHFRRNIIKCSDCGHMFQMNIDETLNKCPDCDSKNIMSLAGGFGHGQCCINNERGGRGHHGGRR